MNLEPQVSVILLKLIVWEELLSEIARELKELRFFLSKELEDFIQDNSFLESISGHLLPDSSSQMRATYVKKRIMDIY